MILAVDIGGTKVTVALFAMESGPLQLVVFKRHLCLGYTGIESVLSEFLRTNNLIGKPISAIAIGVAGPVTSTSARLTNLNWVIDAEKLRQQFACNHVYLLNDLAAHGYAVARRTSDEGLITLRAGSSVLGNKALIAAGTGLGECILFRNEGDGRFYPSPSEGGHASFSPTSDQEVELLRYAWKVKKHFHVSHERLVSGTFGFNLIFDYLRDVEKLPVSGALQKALKVGGSAGASIQNAADEGEEIAIKTMELFVKLYGSEAGNLALKGLATAGVYLGGGIAVKLLSWYDRGGFLHAFNGKGRFSAMLAKIPIYVITDELNASRGAAIYAAEKLQGG